MSRRDALILAALTLLGLLLRLLVWRWRELYELGGDESEYFAQALALLQGKGYRELQLMRPPLYTVFLAVAFQLFDSQVQRVRLVQALISSATIPLFWLWARELFWGHARRDAIALLSAAIAAACYTLAANATELLTETLFVGGLTLVLWLILLAARLRSARVAALAGVALALLCLLRSVALPLVPLAALYLLVSSFEFRVSSSSTAAPDAVNKRASRSSAVPIGNAKRETGNGKLSIRSAVVLVLGAVLVIAPWTLRNYLRYDALIVVDTTGAENLWLDNDPAGREAVKRRLYELGDDRGLRQQLAMQRGREVILADLPRFAAKALGEATRFVALEYFDDLRARRAIWVRPADVWLRLLLGDAVWLLVLCGGSAGLWLARLGDAARADPRWLLAPWALYVFATGLLFHVELRYRLPLYPVLLPFAAYIIVSGFKYQVSGFKLRSHRAASGLPVSLSPCLPVSLSPPRWLGAALTLAAIVALVFAHRSYLAEGGMLARKHWHLWRAHGAIVRGDAPPAHRSAERALELDPESALARVYLGLSSADEALDWWRAAVDVLPAHPYAHLLLGNALREAGDADAARDELAYETHSLEDLQRWSRVMFRRPPQATLDIGDGLDLGAIAGFFPAQDRARWTRDSATVTISPQGDTLLLRLRSPRPAAAAPARVAVVVDGNVLANLDVGADWQEYAVPLGGAAGRAVDLRLATQTFRPRDYDRASPDNRALGVEVDQVGQVSN